MASRSVLSVPRLLAPIRTSAPLRPPKSLGQVKTISSYQGLLGAAKLKPVCDMMYTTEDSNNLVAFYEEAFERWQAEAEKLREIRLLPEDFEELCKIQNYSREQVQELLEAIATDEALDIRRGWVISTNY